MSFIAGLLTGAIVMIVSVVAGLLYATHTTYYTSDE